MAAAARACGITRQAVAFWDRVPGDYVVKVEAATGIPRHLLRSDLHLPPVAPQSAEAV